MTIVENQTQITGGVDTHLDFHVAAAVDINGGVLGVDSRVDSEGLALLPSIWISKRRLIPNRPAA